MKLFICNFGMNRSRTAAEIFNGEYAGILSRNKPVTEELIKNADVIYVMEENQENFIAKNFPKLFKKKKIINLNIKNFYPYMNQELIKILKEKIE